MYLSEVLRDLIIKIKQDVFYQLKKGVIPKIR
jgi:hypothetical protein